MADVPVRLTKALARKRVSLGFVAAAATLVLAQPTWEAWRAGLLIASGGECLRLWAAGHLEKNREVTRSGPYRLLRHPLYAGSALIAIGVAVASRSVAAAVVAVLYVGVTVGAAIRSEEAQLRHAFGSTYDDYRASRVEPMVRRFSLARALRNREYRALGGLILGFALLALKILAPL
ncbi:MAG: isoprenylcysteine carboxylmethyltransferase family protein [Acidobacteria bacterium]|nr:isoprenylcysteine carboxylmethyltransferase family protein [Acidobacteriota bacterium]